MVKLTALFLAIVLFLCVGCQGLTPKQQYVVYNKAHIALVQDLNYKYDTGVISEESLANQYYPVVKASNDALEAFYLALTLEKPTGSAARMTQEALGMLIELLDTVDPVVEKP